MSVSKPVLLALAVPLILATTVQAKTLELPPAPDTRVALESQKELGTLQNHHSPAVIMPNERRVPTQTSILSRSVSRGTRKRVPEVRTMTVTAYTRRDKGMNGRGITASGAPVQEGVTIAAPPEIPFGTRIYIPALDHEYVVMDRGGAIKGDRLDLFMESRERAMEFGKRRLEVLITYPEGE